MTIAKFMLLMLLAASGAVLAVGIVAAVAAILPHAGYELTENGTTALRCLLVGALVGWGPRFFMRWVGVNSRERTG